MNRCKTCDSEMRPLFTGSFCMNDCDRRDVTQVAHNLVGTKYAFQFHGNRWSAKWVDPGGWPEIDTGHRGWHCANRSEADGWTQILKFIMNGANTSRKDTWNSDGPGLPNGANRYVEPCAHPGFVFRRIP